MSNGGLLGQEAIYRAVRFTDEMLIHMEDRGDPPDPKIVSDSNGTSNVNLAHVLNLLARGLWDGEVRQ